EGDTAVPLDEMFDEELELPRQLVHVEGDRIGRITIGFELAASPLEPLDERDGLAVQRLVLRARRGAQVRLERDVAQILLRHDPELIGVPKDGRNRQGNLL